VTKQHWGASAKKKSSMIKGAPTKLGGMNKNPKDPKILSKKKTNTMMLKTK